MSAWELIRLLQLFRPSGCKDLVVYFSANFVFLKTKSGKTEAKVRDDPLHFLVCKVLGRN